LRQTVMFSEGGLTMHEFLEGNKIFIYRTLRYGGIITNPKKCYCEIY